MEQTTVPDMVLLIRCFNFELPPILVLALAVSCETLKQRQH
jgi:hypothetical protein